MAALEQREVQTTYNAGMENQPLSQPFTWDLKERIERGGLRIHNEKFHAIPGGPTAVEPGPGCDICFCFFNGIELLGLKVIKPAFPTIAAHNLN